MIYRQIVVPGLEAGCVILCHRNAYSVWVLDQLRGARPRCFPRRTPSSSYRPTLVVHLNADVDAVVGRFERIRHGGLVWRPRPGLAGRTGVRRLAGMMLVEPPTTRDLSGDRDVRRAGGATAVGRGVAVIGEAHHCVPASKFREQTGLRRAPAAGVTLGCRPFPSWSRCCRVDAANPTGRLLLRRARWCLSIRRVRG